MKTNIVLGLLLAFSLSATAQITISYGDISYPLTPDTAKGKNAVNLGLFPPSLGANQTWNYSNLLGSGNADFVLDLPGANANFSSATGKFEREDFLGPLQLTGLTDYYTHDSTGFYYLGTEIEANGYNISGLTGGAGDELNTLNTFVNFGKTQAKYKLPITANSSWTNTYTTNLDFTVIVNALGLDGDTAQLKRDFTETYEVVGWGKVEMPLNLGMHDALLLKLESKQTDSLFVAGQPADPLLLAGVGLIQGTVTKMSQYEILIRGLNRSALTIDMDSSFTTVNYIHFCTTPSTFSIEEALEVEASVYPNPTSTGAVNFSFFKPTSKEWSLQIVDALGRSVSKLSIPESGQVKRQFVLPVYSGVYYYVLEDEEQRARSIGKVIKK